MKNVLFTILISLFLIGCSASPTNEERLEALEVSQSITSGNIKQLNETKVSKKQFQDLESRINQKLDNLFEVLQKK